MCGTHAECPLPCFSTLGRQHAITALAHELCVVWGNRTASQVALAFISYFGAQAAHLSGICSIVFCAMVRDTTAQARSSLEHPQSGALEAPREIHICRIRR